MADKKITDLNLHLEPELSDSLPIVNNSETKKVSYGTLYNKIRNGLVSGSGTAIDTGSFATTGSNTFIGDQNINGDITASGELRLGTLNTDVHEITGSLRVSGSIGTNILIGTTIFETPDLGDLNPTFRVNENFTVNHSEILIKDATAENTSYIRVATGSGNFEFGTRDSEGTDTTSFVVSTAGDLSTQRIEFDDSDTDDFNTIQVGQNGIVTEGTAPTTGLGSIALAYNSYVSSSGQPIRRKSGPAAIFILNENGDALFNMVESGSAQSVGFPTTKMKIENGGMVNISGSLTVTGSITGSSIFVGSIRNHVDAVASEFGGVALGAYTNATGNGAVATGLGTYAVGQNSFTQGEGTIASGSYQMAVGRWNKKQNTKDLFVIGNGLPGPESNRSDLAHFTTSSLEIEGFISASTYYGDGSNLTGIVHPTGSLVTKAYGSFFDTTTQSGSADNAYVVKHNTTDFGSGVSMVNGTRITMAEAGVYTIISTQQYKHTSGGTVNITGWLRKNGTDVPNSATDLRLKGNGAAELYAINYFVSASAGDYYELIWSPDDSSTEIINIGARTSPTRPAVPSVITTVNRVG